MDDKIIKGNCKGFAKLDSGKIDMSLLPPIIMQAYCEVATHGAAKYGRHNCRLATLQDASRLYAAMMRHLVGYEDSAGQIHGYLRGSTYDADSGLNELWQALWGMCELIVLCERYGYTQVRDGIVGANVTGDNK